MDNETLRRYELALTPHAPRRSVEEQVAALRSVVFDLLTEVEALRATIAGDETLRARYAAAYRATAIVAHDSAGLKPGTVKALENFVTAGREEVGLHAEEPMLRRLGVDIVQYRRDVDSLHHLT
jgi:hypothetical protein